MLGILVLVVPPDTEGQQENLVILVPEVRKTNPTCSSFVPTEINCKLGLISVVEEKRSGLGQQVEFWRAVVHL